jgi:glycosyltransferase involved in cell wall biosynthesis
LQDGDPYEKVFKRWFIRIVSPLLNAGFRNASVVQAISKYLAEWAPRRGYKGPVEIIYNGANARDFTEKYSKEELDDFKKKTGKKEGDIFMVTTSRLSHKNGIDTVIRAMPLLPENVYFLVVGGGEDEKMLKDLAKELNVEKRVVFVGQVDRTETPKYRRISEIFVRPSRSEGFGNSFASAMAAKIPVIATQEGGIAEFLFDAKRNPDKPATGWAVDKDNPGQIAEAVKDILSNPEKVKKTTETAYKMTYEKYNWDSIAKDMKERIFYVLVKNSG